MKLILALLATLSLSACGSMDEFVCRGAGTCYTNAQGHLIMANGSQTAAVTAKTTTQLSDHKPDFFVEYNRRLQDRLDQMKAEGRAKLARCAGKNKNSKPVSDKVRKEVEDRYKEVLKDPYSAHFRKIVESSEWDQCMEFKSRYHGEVNAKNSYGGYTGYTEFTTN